MSHFKPTQKFNLFGGWDFSTFFSFIWFKSTKMKLRPYFTMENVQKLMKKTQKYLFYSPLTEDNLTEWPGAYIFYCQPAWTWISSNLIWKNKLGQLIQFTMFHLLISPIIKKINMIRAYRIKWFVYEDETMYLVTNNKRWGNMCRINICSLNYMVWHKILEYFFYILAF